MPQYLDFHTLSVVFSQALSTFNVSLYVQSQKVMKTTMLCHKHVSMTSALRLQVTTEKIWVFNSGSQDQSQTTLITLCCLYLGFYHQDASGNEPLSNCLALARP